MQFFAVSFNGHRSTIVKASDPCDAATASAIRKYQESTIRVNPTTRGKILWDITDATTGALLGFCSVHKPKDQRACYLRHKSEQEQKFFCSECGRIGEVTDTYCSECGYKLT